MLLRRLLHTYLSLGAIVGPLPNNIVDGAAVDAVPVMANFNWLLGQINANAASAATVSALQSTVNGYGQRASFTPGVAFGGASVGVTYFGQSGYAFPLQNAIFVVGAVRVNSKGSSAGVLTVTGLPTSAALTWPANGYPMTVMLDGVTIPGSASAVYPVGSILPGGGAMSVLGMVSGLSPSSFNNVDCAAGFSIEFMGIYPTS